MPKPTTGRKALLGKVHIAKKQLGLDDEMYRQILTDRYGVASSAKLSLDKLKDLCAHFERKGWKPTEKPPRAGCDRTALISKVHALLAEIGRMSRRHVPFEYAESILKRQGGPAKLQWGTPDQLRGVIAALDKRVKKLAVAEAMA